MTPVFKTFSGLEAINLLFGGTSAFPPNATRCLHFFGRTVQLLELFRMVGPKGCCTVTQYPPRRLTRMQAINVLSAALSREKKHAVSVVDFWGDNRRQQLVVAIRPELTEEELEVEAAHQAR